LGANAAINGLCSYVAKRLDRTPQRRAGGRDVIDQQHGSTSGSRAGRKAHPRQFETAGAGEAGLAAETVPSQKSINRFFELPGDRSSEQLGGGPRLPQTSPGVRGNGDHDIDFRGPGLGGHRCREAMSERCREIVTPAVFEGEDCRAEYSIVLAPHHRCALWWRVAKADQTRLAAVFSGNAAAGAGAAGSRHGERPARPAQTTIVAVERMIAVWTHAGKQGLNRRGQRAPLLHDAHPTRMTALLEGCGLEIE
jgi:hypothetical protein